MATQRNHQNNFATNLTSNQIAGVTTTPLNSIPSVAAPFSIALDATNINGKYEIVEVTSKTTTNINHAATTYAHTTAEEVRMVVGATELDEFASAVNGAAPIKEFAPQGFLQNGKISVTDTGSGINVAIKTLAGTDPSSTDPVYCRIGDTVQSITAALSKTVADGVNTFNAGSAELATKEIDFPVFLSHNATDGVVIGFSRYFGSIFSDFSTTATNEKYLAYSGSNAAASDPFEVIGRFAATLSAGAGYTWSVPTFTAANLIQRPIYETRDIDFVPNITNCQTAITYSSQIGKYKVRHNRVTCTYYISVNTVTNNGNDLRIPAPFTAKTVSGSYTWWGVGKWLDSGVAHYIMGVLITNGSAYFNQWVYNGGANMSGTPLSATDIHQATIEYEI